jgi:hypothetical protein
LKEDKKKKSLLILELETKMAAAVEDENCLGIW